MIYGLENQHSHARRAHSTRTESPPMSTPVAPDTTVEQDPIEAIVAHIPVVLPVVGAVLIFLLAFIAVSMA